MLIVSFVCVELECTSQRAYEIIFLIWISVALLLKVKTFSKSTHTYFKKVGAPHTFSFLPFWVILKLNSQKRRSIYIEVTLDKRLDWNSHLSNVTKKVTRAFYACERVRRKNIFEVIWRFSSRFWMIPVIKLTDIILPKLALYKSYKDRIPERDHCEDIISTIEEASQARYTNGSKMDDESTGDQDSIKVCQWAHSQPYCRRRSSQSNSLFATRMVPE